MPNIEKKSFAFAGLEEGGCDVGCGKLLASEKKSNDPLDPLDPFNPFNRACGCGEGCLFPPLLLRSSLAGGSVLIAVEGLKKRLSASAAPPLSLRALAVSGGEDECGCRVGEDDREEGHEAE